MSYQAIELDLDPDVYEILVGIAKETNKTLDEVVEEILKRYIQSNKEL